MSIQTGFKGWGCSWPAVLFAAGAICGGLMLLGGQSLLRGSFSLQREKHETVYFEPLELLARQELLLAEQRVAGEVVYEDILHGEIFFFPLTSTTLHEVLYSARCGFGVKAVRNGWKFELDGDILKVYAPALSLLHASIETPSIRIRTQSGWLSFSESVVREELVRSLGIHARIEATSKRTLERVRPMARESLVKIVHSWLPPSMHVKVITVRFADDDEILCETSLDLVQSETLL